MPVTNISGRLYRNAVRMQQLRPEVDLETQLAQISQHLFSDSTSVMNALLQGEYHERLLTALTELAADCYLLAAVAGADLDALLDGYVSRSEQQRLPQPGQAAPNADQVQTGVQPQQAYTAPVPGSVPGASPVVSDPALARRGIRGW